MEYYSALKKNATTKCAGKWMDLEFIIFSEVAQSPKEKKYTFSLYNVCVSLFKYICLMYIYYI